MMFDNNIYISYVEMLSFGPNDLIMNNYYLQDINNYIRNENLYEL